MGEIFDLWVVVGQSIILSLKGSLNTLKNKIIKSLSTMSGIDQKGKIRFG